MRNNIFTTKNALLALLTLLAACQPKENKEQLKAINVSLEKSNALINETCWQPIYEMENKQRQFVGDERVTKWLAIMKKIKSDTDSIVSVIENLKTEIKDGTSTKSLNEPNGEGYMLLNKLASFKDNIFTVFDINSSGADTTFSSYLKKDLLQLQNTGPLLPGYGEILKEEQRTHYINKWLNSNLRGSSVIMTIMVLNKLENDLLYTRTALLNYCNNQVGIIDDSGMIDKVSAIAVISSSCVKRGETIEVTAGTAEFSTRRKPSISIYGKAIKLDDQGIAYYQFKATGKPGKHILPVNISFLWKDGRPGNVIKNLEYTIADEK